MLKDLLFVIKSISTPLYINKLDLKVNRYDDINSGTKKLNLNVSHLTKR